MKWKTLLWAVSVFSQSAIAIFADDAFHIDYHHALLGLPQSHTTFFHKPQAASNASLLYTISDKAILGAINPKDGSTLWRQGLKEQPVENAVNTFLVAGERDGQITSGYRNSVKCWDALDGKLKWEYSLANTAIVRGLQLASILGSGTDSTMQDLIVLAGGETDDIPITLSRISGDGSGERWKYTDSSSGGGASVSVATTEKFIYYIAKSHGLLAGSKAKVAVLDSTTGKEKSQYIVALDSVPLGPGEQYAIASSSSAPFLASTEQPYKTIKLNLLGNSKLTTITLDDKSEEILNLRIHPAGSPSANPHFLVHVSTATRQWAEIFHINTKTGDAIKAYLLPATAEQSTFAAASVGSATYFIRTTDSEVSLYSSESHAQLGRWPRKGARAMAVEARRQSAHAAAEVVSGKTGFAVRVAEASPGGDFSLIRNGEMQWSRPEMLAYALVASWTDGTSNDHLIAEMAVEASANPLIAYLHRLKRHAHDLAGLPDYLRSLPALLTRAPEDNGPTTRQKLVGTKLVVIGTSLQEVLAVDGSSSGTVIWQTDLASTVASSAVFKTISVVDGLATLYMSDGAFVVVNATNGALLEHKQGAAPFSALVQIPGQPVAAIITVDAHGKPQVAKELASSAAVEGNAVVTLSEEGNAFGWTVGQAVERTWTLQPKTGAKFVNVVGRPAHDPVASIGKVLGDRSVLYKYISPNLALLTALSPTEGTFYLIDAVTGAVLHTSSHSGILAGSAMPAVISENWFAYSFTSQNPATSALSTQLIISELYESATSNDRGALSARTNYSSFSTDAGATPYVISQAYTVAEPISNLAVSQTAQGITSRQLLATLPNSNAIIGIPREVLNARRPVDRDPLPVEQEEGLFRYSPVLELDPKLFLTHSREVMGIKKMITSPTLLESTGLVFAFGHDIFGSQIAPSATFDVLGKAFNKIQLTLTVVALFVGVIAVRPLVRKKMVEGRWST